MREEISNIILKNAGSIVIICAAMFAVIKFVHYVLTRKETRREAQKEAFDKIVACLSAESGAAQLSAAILLRRFMGTKIAELYPYLEKETVNVISSLAKSLPTNTFQKTLVDGLAYASDLSNCDLQKTNLQDVYLGKKNGNIYMNNTDLYLADLSYALLEHINGQGLIFYRAVLFCAKIKNCDLTGANFTGADLTNTTFDNVILRNAKFNDAMNIPDAIASKLVNGVYPDVDEKVFAKSESKGKTIFFSMPGVMSKEDEVMTKDFKHLLERIGYEVIYYQCDTYPNFGQFNKVRTAIMRSSAMVAFGLKQINIHKASYRPGTHNATEWGEKWLSTPWSEIEVGMGLMKGMPILLICDPAIRSGVFDTGLSECFIGRISTDNDSRQIERNPQFEAWLSKI